MSFEGAGPTNVIEIKNTAQFNALATAGVITLTGKTTFIFNSPIGPTATRIELTAAFPATELHFFSSDIVTASLTYIGTGDFISGTGNFRTFSAIDLLNNGGGTFISITGNVVMVNTRFAGWAELGIINRGVFTYQNSVIINCLAGYTLSDSSYSLENVGLFNSPLVSAIPFFRIDNVAADVNAVGQFSNILGELISGASLLRINPATRNEPTAIYSGIGAGFKGVLFDTSGATGIFTAVADAAVSATAITGVSDNGGVAEFAFTGPTVFVGQEVVISAFASETTYNGTFLITATDGTSSFEVTSIAFTGDDSGSFLSNSVTITDALTPLEDGDEITINTLFATDYDGGAVLYNQLTNSFQVNRTFTTTQEGTWSEAGLDQTDRRILAVDNSEFADSAYIATAFVNDNSDPTTGIVNGVFQDMVFGTGGSALVAGSTLERWKLIDEINGLFEYTGFEPYDGLLTFDFTVKSAGSAIDYRFKWVNEISAVSITDGTIAFAVNNTITQANAEFLSAGFEVGDRFNVSGSVGNDNNYTIATVTAGTITTVETTIAFGGAGPTVTIAGLDRDLPDNVEALVNLGTASSSITKTFPLSAVTNDRIKPQVTRDSGGSSITASYATIYAQNPH